MIDIVELLENLSVSPHQQSIIDSAVDEIVKLRRALNQIIAEMEYESGNGDIALKIAKQAKEGK